MTNQAVAHSQSYRSLRSLSLAERFQLHETSGQRAVNTYWPRLHIALADWRMRVGLDVPCGIDYINVPDHTYAFTGVASTPSSDRPTTPPPPLPAHCGASRCVVCPSKRPDPADGQPVGWYALGTGY